MPPRFVGEFGLARKMRQGNPSRSSIRIIASSMRVSRASRRSMRASLMSRQPINSFTEAKQSGTCGHRGEDNLPAVAIEIPRFACRTRVTRLHIWRSRQSRGRSARRAPAGLVVRCRPSSSSRGAKPLGDAHHRISGNLRSISSSINRILEGRSSSVRPSLAVNQFGPASCAGNDDLSLWQRENPPLQSRGYASTAAG